MINKNILMSRLTDKFKVLTLHSIVNECFVNGLPINQSEISDREKKSLTKYSYDVLNTLGGFSVLENAIDVDKKSFKQNLLLGEIYNVCTEAATEAAKRVCNETDCKDPSTNINDVVDKASFTEDEYNKFAAKANKIGLDDIQDIIKEKTLTVIKDEQEQYEKEEQLDEELKEALSTSDDFSETTTEAYMDLFLSKNDPRHHITLFSRLQETAMEMMNIVKPDDEEDIFPLLNKVTFEGFIDDLKVEKTTFDSAVESLCTISNCNQDECCVSKECQPKLATLVSIIAYTVLETLKTINMYCPSQDCIRKFVNKSVDTDCVIKNNIDQVYARAEEKLHEANMIDFSKVNSRDLANRLTDLKKFGDLIQGTELISNESARAMNIMENIDKQVNEITTVLHKRDLEMKNNSMATESYYDNYNRSNDLAQFNKVGHLFGKNPNVSEIRLKINPDKIQSVIDVEAANEAGQVIKSTFMNMQYACEDSKYIDYLKESFDKSGLSDCEKRVCLLINDGTGRKINLN